MAEATMKLELCAPDRELVTLEIRHAVVAGEAGVFSVYPGHTPFLSTLIPGVFVAEDHEGNEHFYAVQGGFAEIRDGVLTILADTFESEDDIDVERARVAEERAQERLRKPLEDMEWKRAEIALARAIARIRTSDRDGYH